MTPATLASILPHHINDARKAGVLSHRHINDARNAGVLSPSPFMERGLGGDVETKSIYISILCNMQISILQSIYYILWRVGISKTPPKASVNVGSLGS